MSKISNLTRFVLAILTSTRTSAHRGAETSTIMGLVAAFIGIAIMLGIGIQILGNTTFTCTDLPGTATTGWEGQCEDAQTSTQNAYALLIVILIVVAAVSILFVVRML